MKPERARALVADTFPKAFDKVRFHHFVKELLNGFNEDKSAPMAVPDAFARHVRSCARLGTYESPDGELADVLIVHTTEPWKLERTRTALRDFVAHKLKRGDSYKEAGLVAFVSPDARSWRFSFVRMEYKSKRDPKTGKIAVEEHLTPARRFSYIVGENESCHTAQSRFLDLLRDTETKPPLAKIEEAFSVETVTDEFFEQYKELFLDLTDDIEALAKKDKVIAAEFSDKKVSTADFAKKLMGQIVFLYFLQKKGWLGVPKGKDWGDGPHNFLRRLFNGKFGDYKNFFNDILEPLFYDTLATDRKHEAWCNKFNCRIPFLNGGLFEPLRDYDWNKTDIIIPNRIFANSDFVEEGVTGTGILDVFDRYNFTVNEAEPLEKEVAIDPEMLGKVFENLLGVAERKSKGSFYTPREIVHYMCQESLVNYLDTALNSPRGLTIQNGSKQGKLFDPPEPEQMTLKTSISNAVVPRADLETFIRSGDQASHYEAARVEGTSGKRQLPKSIEQHARLIDEKLATITVCDLAIGSGAFPVGMMQEIVRARSALTPYFNDVHDRTPYHFKRHAIQNCLYGVDIDPGAVEIAKLRLWLSLVVDEDDVKQIKPLPNLDYKIVVGNSLMGFPFKSQRQEEIEKLKLKFFDEPDHDLKAKLKKQIDAELSACFAAAKKSLGYEVTFDFGVYFSEVFESKGGFDVIIGNPPYVHGGRITELKSQLKSQYACFTATSDLYVYFYERGVKLLRSRGALALITSNKFFRSSYGEKLREFLSRETTLNQIIDFGDAPVFDAMAYPCIVILRRQKIENHQTRALSWEQGKPVEMFEQIFQTTSFDIAQEELTAEGWRLEPPAVLRLLEKLHKAGQPLDQYVNGRFYYGIKTGLNEAFVVDRATRDRLIREHKSSAEILKPFLRGRDVKRWRVEYADLYLIKIASSENKLHPWSRKSEKDAEKIFAQTYPAIHEHFQSLKEIKLDEPDDRGCRDMLEKLQRRDDQGKFFWELRSCKYWKDFDATMIAWGNLATAPQFTLVEGGYYISAPATFLVSDSKYLLGLLNSQITKYLVSQSAASRQGGFWEYKPMYVSPLAIPAVPREQKKPVERLVERILSAKQRDAGADVSALERELDKLVYVLYGLTPEEIAVIEKSGEAEAENRKVLQRA